MRAMAESVTGFLEVVYRLPGTLVASDQESRAPRTLDLSSLVLRFTVIHKRLLL